MSSWISTAWPNRICWAGVAGETSARKRSRSESLVSLEIPAGTRLDEQRMHPAHEPDPLVADVGVALGEQPQHLAVANRLGRSRPRLSSATSRRRRSLYSPTERAGISEHERGPHSNRQAVLSFDRLGLQTTERSLVCDRRS